MTTFIDDHKQLWGVEPICAQLPIAPSTYYAAKGRPPLARSISDADMKSKVLKVYEDNYKVYGARKILEAVIAGQGRGRPGPGRPPDA